MRGSRRGKPSSAIQSPGYVAHSLEAAIWCVGRTGTFKDAVLLAANLGDDADTVAAITGQLAGALFGYKAIRSEWMGEVTNQGVIFGLARQLVDTTSAASACPKLQL